MGKITTVVLILLLNYCFSENEFLSKFNQNDYKIKDVRMDTTYVNYDYYNFQKVVTFTYNRSVAAINLTMRMKIDFYDKVQVTTQVYKFASNEYRTFPVRFRITMQNAFEANILGLQSIRKCGNLTEIYFLKDITYHFCNFVIDEKKLPPLIPTGLFKVEASIMLFEETISIVNIYLEIYRSILPPMKH